MVETEKIDRVGKILFYPGNYPGIPLSSEEDLFYFREGKSFFCLKA